jgi:hypothetical protein
MRPEYDFAAMKGGVRGKYVWRYRAGTNLVLLEPEVAEAFPNDAAVNEALRAVLRATRVVKRTARLPNRQLQRTTGVVKASAPRRRSALS